VRQKEAGKEEGSRERRTKQRCQKETRRAAGSMEDKRKHEGRRKQR
jgi:hypothetical protein